MTLIVVTQRYLSRFVASRGAFVLPSGHLELAPRAKQLQQIVGEAYQLPFGSDLLQTAEREMPEAAPLLDLSKHWFDDCLAHSVQIASRIGVQLLFHLLPQ